MKHLNKPGYIIVLTMLIISIAMLLITYIVNRGFYAIPFATVTVSREKAKMLSLSGIQIAMSKLAGKPISKKQEAKLGEGDQGSKQESIDKGTKYFLEEVLPYINRALVFTLKEQTDGIDGTIELVITSEEGKINPNNFYDFKKKEFKGAKDKDGGMKKQLETLLAGVGKLAGAPNLVAALETFYKREGQPLIDITELLTVPAFEPFKDKLFYDLPLKKEKTSEGAKIPMYLTDIFSIYNDQTHLDPWLLSNSLAAGLGLKTMQPQDVAQRKELIKTLEKNFKPFAAWPQDWDKTMNQWLGKPFASLPKGIEPLLSTTFSPRYFSVLSVGTYKKVTVRTLAIIERTQRDTKEKTVYEVSVKKLYWL